MYKVRDTLKALALRKGDLRRTLGTNYPCMKAMSSGRPLITRYQI